ncbi:MAG: hypothetical protein SPE03_02625, partial [Treponema sp.]|nr:hypothetical protein [Treponema sp.]
CARRFLGYRNYYNAALAAAPKKVFLPCVSLPRANFYENIFYNAFALLRQPLQSLLRFKTEKLEIELNSFSKYITYLLNKKNRNI